VAHALGSAFDAGLGGFMPALSWKTVAMAAGVNLALAVLGAATRVVRPSGAVAGALLGSVVLACGGFRLYVLLLAFFGVGTLATRFRKAQKEAMGKAEAEGGRRGAENVLSKVSVPAFGALVAAFLPPQLAARSRGGGCVLRDRAHGHAGHRGGAGREIANGAPPRVPGGASRHRQCGLRLGDAGRPRGRDGDRRWPSPSMS
jgi:hypothetical protein